MNRIILSVIAMCLFTAASCKSTEPAKPAPAKVDAPVAPPVAKKWHDDITGTYKGVVGGNSDEISLTFTHVAGELAATYTINDPEFDAKPYAGKLMKFTETKGKEMTLTCRYEDAMNAGGYELTFSKDLKKLTGTYIIDGEGESDANGVTATKQ